MANVVTPLTGTAKQDLRRLKKAVKRGQPEECKRALGKLKRDRNILFRAIEELAPEELEFLREKQLVAA